MKKFTKKDTFVNKKYKTIVLFLVFIITAFYFHYAYKITVHYETQSKLQLTKKISNVLYHNYVDKLTGSSEDLEKPEYQYLKSILETVSNIYKEVEFAYIYYIKEDRMYFLVDSEPIDSVDYSPPGQEYFEASKDDISAYKNGKSTITGPATDRWGNWVSILVPIQDETGKVCAVFGMDYPSNAFIKMILKDLSYALLIYLLIFILLTFYFLIMIKNKELKTEKNQLVIAIERIEKINNRLDEAQEIAHVGNWEYDIENRTYYFSKESLKILGIHDQSNTIEVEKLKNLIVEEHRNKRNQAIHELIEENKPYDIEFTIKKLSNQEEIIIHSRAKAQRDENGKAIKILGVLQDITLKRLIEDKMRKNEEQFTSIFNQSPMGIGLKDLESGYIYGINQKFSEILHRSTEELSTIDWKELIHEDDYVQYLENLQLLNDGEINNFNINMRFFQPDNTIAWIHMKVTGIVIGEQHMHLYMLEDISERISMEESLEESRRSTTVLLSNLPGMAYRCKYDSDWTMEFVSNGCYELTGFTPEEIINNRVISFNQIISFEFRDYLFKMWEENLPLNKKCQVEYIITTATGERKWVWEQGVGVYDKDGNVIAIEGLILDITDRKIREDKIKYLNYHDALTGIFNRRYFEKQRVILDKAENLPISVITGDINGLKIINDALGHDQGDKLIIETAKLINSCLRNKDIFSRTGGDEFYILLPRTELQEAEKIIENIEQKCNYYNQNVNNELYNINISLGVGCKKVFEECLSEILKEAENHMYRHKLLEHKSFHSSIIASMKRTMFERSQDTKEHAERLVRLGKELGKELGLTQEELDKLELFATLHDIGKIGISNTVLEKPESLSESDWIEMKKHPEAGYRIAMASPELVPIADYILTHHERWDGTGYPQGLKGENIPKLSRILSIVDAYDAMTQNRIYRKAMSKEKAINELSKNMGKQFDPEFTKVFIQYISKQEDTVIA